MHKESILFAIVLGLNLGASPTQDQGPSAKEIASAPLGGTSGIQGILEVDPDSGAASLFFPMGPGIGRQGLRYIPALVGRFAPQVGSAPTAFELSPGSLDWPLVPNGLEEAPPGVRWTYPDGTGACANGPFPGELNPDEVLARFGYGPPVRQDHLPHLGSAPPAPLALGGTTGECLLAPAADSEVPVTTPPDLLEGEIREKDRWAIPACLLVVRGNLAYEFRYAGPKRPGGSSGIAHYRLTAVRTSSGENVTFTYGPNGTDFEATWTDARVRVALEAVEGVAPVPALDATFPALDSMAPCETFRDVEARLRITYEGSLAETPGYTVSILLRAEDLPGKSPVDAMGSRALPPAFGSPLQVARVQADGSGETVRFTYGKGPAVDVPGPDGARHCAPTVVQEIALPQRSLRLDWEPQPWPDALAQTEDTRGPEPRWSFGVKAVYEKGAPTYERVAPDGYAPAASQSVSRNSFPEPLDSAGSEEAGGPSWVRQSRHFAFASTPRTGGSCETVVRDRWILQGTGRKPNPGPPQTPRSFAGDNDGDIPTFEWDSRERILVPVPGEMTRRLDWEPGTDTAPDLHRVGHQDGRTTGGLKGGNPGRGGAGTHPAGGDVWPTPIRYDPTTHEVTMGAIAGGPPPPGPGAPPSVRVSSAGEVLNQQVTRSQQDIQQTTQQAFELAADRQAFATQQAALAQTAHDARMATIQNQMAGQAQAQLEQAQAKNQGWPYPIADALIVIYPHEPFQANVEVQQGIQGDIHQATDLQGRVGEGQHHVAEKFRQAVEAIKRAAEAKRQAREARNGPLPEQNLQAIVVLRPFADGMQDKPGEVLILFWDWQEGGVVGEQGSVGHVATAVKSKNEWIIIHSQFPHSNGGKPCPAGPNTTIATPYDLLDAENRRKPNSAYLLTVPNLGGFANYMIADLEKPLWEMAPGRQGGSTNCTYGTIHGLRAGGVPLSSMWANQTLIIPLAPYLPRDLRTALERDVSFNLIHNYKIYHKNELIEAIHWEKTKHE